MKKHNHTHDHDRTATAEAATGTLATIADVAGEKLDEVRQQVEEAQKQTDNFLRARPYQAMAVAIGIGALFGFMAGRKLHRD